MPSRRGASSSAGAGYALAVAPVDPTEARFPGRAGESRPLRELLPQGSATRRSRSAPGSATRSTSGPARRRTGSLWFTLFEPSRGPRRRQGSPRRTRPAGGGDWLRVGEARWAATGRRGRIGDEVAWELRFEGAEVPLFHLPRAWMYRARLPRTKLLSPAPAARFSGRAVRGRARDPGGRLARDGRAQLGRAARRALDLAARADPATAIGSTRRSAA